MHHARRTRTRIGFARALTLTVLGTLTGCAPLHVRGMRAATDAFVDSGDFRAARAMLDRAVADAERSRHDRDLGAALTARGFASYAALMTTGATTGYEDAHADLLRSLSLTEGPRARAMTLIYLGIVEEKLRDEKSAFSRYQEALALAQSAGARAEESYALRHIAFIEQRRGNLSSALARQERSLELRRQVGMMEYVPFSLMSIGGLYEELGRRTDAIALYREAERLASGRRRTRILALLSLGAALLESGEPEEAVRSIERAAAIAEEIGDRRDLAAARELLDTARR